MKKITQLDVCTLTLLKVTSIQDYFNKFDDIRVMDMVLGKDNYNPRVTVSVPYDRPTCKRVFDKLFTPGVSERFTNKYKEEFKSFTVRRGDNQYDTYFEKITDVPPFLKWDVLMGEKRFKRIKHIINTYQLSDEDVNLLNQLPNQLIKYVKQELQSKYPNSDSQETHRVRLLDYLVTNQYT